MYLRCAYYKHFFAHGSGSLPELGSVGRWIDTPAVRVTVLADKSPKALSYPRREVRLAARHSEHTDDFELKSLELMASHNAPLVRNNKRCLHLLTRAVEIHLITPPEQSEMDFHRILENTFVNRFRHLSLRKGSRLGLRQAF